MGVDDQSVHNFRDEIYVFGGFYLQQMTLAVKSEQIYKSAIVRTNTMQLLRPNRPPQPPVRQPIPPLIEIPPLNWMPTEEVDQFIANYREFVTRIMQNQLFVRSWQQMFNEFASQQTSITIDNDGQQTVVLWNGHQFTVTVTRIRVSDVNLYSLLSKAFTDNLRSGYHLSRPQNGLPWLAYRKLGKQHWAPLHSHGLTGHLNADNEFAGNNGCQAMTLQFPEIDALNHQRLYFVNRAMARELLDIFERQQLISQYHQWFEQLLAFSKTFCDLRLRFRNGENLIDIEWLRNGSRVLGRLAMLLTLKYDCLTRLEQIWKYSVLVANVNATEQRDREPMVTFVAVQDGMYGKGSSRRLNALW
ncbi:uncharacterized protein LOC128965928 [Oppia nitens]|uniref:uncharacterized protein LOC128965928 n=1 Tax=Oppia nitens TaxID=1686743 RepID=UPI0023DA5021|nr:uncharacterized protein LOC128965928 [Oppia nitens]